MYLKRLVLATVFAIAAMVQLANAATAEELAATAIDDEYSTAMSAIRQLRMMGPTGLDALFVKYATEIERFSTTGEPDEQWKRIANALDTVAMQKDAYAAHLYWYTDLDEAKRVAEKQHKPILTLRLLGNLNEEFSCANSRLFRALLYSNTDVSKFMRDNYVLHWQSVRPAPRVTIDFGDGRKIERTITGNSIHYILDPDGEVIDALPGLYSPFAFKKYLVQAFDMNKLLKSMPNERHALALMKYRKASFDQLIKKRDKGVEVSGVSIAETPNGTSAILAAPIAAAKMVVVDEYSILQVYDDFAKFSPSVDLREWQSLAKLYSPNNTLDEKSVAFIRRQNRKTGLSEEEFMGMFAKLEKYIAIDTTRNDFLFHAKLYQWLNSSRGKLPLESLNSLVYAQIFQTPEYDKWLGLYSTDVYTAIDGNGLIGN